MKSALEFNKGKNESTGIFHLKMAIRRTAPQAGRLRKFQILSAGLSLKHSHFENITLVFCDYLCQLAGREISGSLLPLFR